jgi:hypothetical protein
MLIYAAGAEPEQTYRIEPAGKTLEVRTLDLDQPPGAVLQQIAELAVRIREMRSMAVGFEQARITNRTRG